MGTDLASPMSPTSRNLYFKSEWVHLKNRDLIVTHSGLTSGLYTNSPTPVGELQTTRRLLFSYGRRRRPGSCYSLYTLADPGCDVGPRVGVVRTTSSRFGAGRVC